MSVGAGDNKTLPERARTRGHALHDAAGSAVGDRRATLFEDGALLIGLAAALEAAEAKRDSAERDAAALSGQDYLRRAEAAEARVAALEAENAELKGLKAGGDRVARAEEETCVCGHPRAAHYVVRPEKCSKIPCRCAGFAAAAVRPQTDPKPDARDPVCIEKWPECRAGEYDPRCCRFPKSCSCWLPDAAAAVRPQTDTPEPPVVPENRDAPCNTCGRGWPYHEPTCAYAGNVRDLRAAQARCHTYEDALRDIVTTPAGSFAIDGRITRADDFMKAIARAALASTDTPDQALNEFLAASIAVWRSIDQREAMPGGYSAHPLTQDTELRKIERAAWERYRETLSEAGSSAADTSVGERQGRQPASLSACARYHTYEEALRAQAENLGKVLALADSIGHASFIAHVQTLYHNARAALASSEREKGEGLGGPQSGPSGGEQT